MRSFFTSPSPKKSPKQDTAVFAGLDDPFNFPTNKMRYKTRLHSRTASPDSAHDSGYCSSASPDEDSPLSPKSHVSRPQLPSQDRRRLHKDGKGHRRMHSYEYQSEHNDRASEREPILQASMPCMSTEMRSRREADNEHEWKPNLKHTFTFICGEAKGPKWYTSRVYGRALERKEKSEGVTDLQRSMAPTIRRPSPSPSTPTSRATKEHPLSARPPPGPRKKSTLLHPSPPPAAATLTACTTVLVSSSTCESQRPGRGRTRKPSTLLHPSPAPSPVSTVEPTLRDPRNRSPTPLGIPTTSQSQPTPTPLRIRLHRYPPHTPSLRSSSRRSSVLHSCFSDTDSDHSSDDDDSDNHDAPSFVSRPSDKSHETNETDALHRAAGGAGNEVVLARTAWVARAQRVRVGRTGLESWVLGG